MAGWTPWVRMPEAWEPTLLPASHLPGPSSSPPQPTAFSCGKTSCLFMHFMTAGLPRPIKKKCKEATNKIPSELPPGLGNLEHTEQSTHVLRATDLAGRVSPVAQLWQQSLGALGLSRPLQCNSHLVSCCHRRGWK